MNSRLTVKRIEPGSLAKMMGALYAAIGLIAGAVLSLFSILGGLAGLGAGRSSTSLLFGFGGGMAAVILAPILYGLIGLIGGFITAIIYNFVADIAGGIVFDTESSTTSGVS